jgi:ribosomal protein S18 acetylase RimI-like enzyme
MFADAKDKLNDPVVHRIISYASFDGSPEGIAKTVQKYQLNPELYFYAWIGNGQVLGICGYEIHNDKVEIHLISVDEQARGRGVGGDIILALLRYYGKDIEAETDDEAVGFYRKRGFTTHEFIHETRGKRHTCVLKTL